MSKFETNLTDAWIRKFSSRGFWTGRILTDYLDDAVRHDPGKTAIIDARGSCTYGELRALSIRCAFGLLALGLKPGDVMSVQLPNWKEFTILHLAATRIGVVTNPLVPMFRDRELHFMIGVAESRLLVVPEAFRGYDHAAAALRLKEQLPMLEEVIVVGEDVPGGTRSWRSFIQRRWEKERTVALDALRPDANAVTELIYTSGTTADPKAVLHTHNTLIASQVPVINTLRLTSESVLHIASTFGHQTGMLSGVRLPIHLGATVVYQHVWSTKGLLDLIERHRITISSGSPTFLQDVLSSPDLPQRDLSSLRIFRCGGAPIPRVLIGEARRLLPGVSVHSAWGQTENAIVTLTRPGDPEDKIAGTDGHPLEGMEVRVMDGENRPVQPGCEGRLQCRGAFLFVGYAKRPDLTREAFVDGWFDTGDLAVMDAEGFIQITGRTKDIIIRGGENIPVAYIENVLYEDPRIKDVAVVAVPDLRLGERACAFISLRADAAYSFADMQGYLQQKGVAKQYWPEELRIVDGMPRTPSGKIRKHELRRIFTPN
jgi:cyclohexanecarboxylate-CoA ligase